MATLPLPGLPLDPERDPDAVLVRGMARGDEHALRELYDTLAPRVFGLARQILRDDAAAEDAVVDVFAQVWRQAARYEPWKGSVASWVCTIARTRAIDIRRQRQRHTLLEATLEETELGALHDSLASPFQSALVHDRASVVRRALAGLAPEQRRALEAAYFGGLSHTEIAALFHCPLGTIKTRIRAGLATLRVSLASLETEDDG